MAAPGKKILASFSEFDVTASNNCDSDYVVVTTGKLKINQRLLWGKIHWKFVHSEQVNYCRRLCCWRNIIKVLWQVSAQRDRIYWRHSWDWVPHQSGRQLQRVLPRLQCSHQGWIIISIIIIINLINEWRWYLAELEHLMFNLSSVLLIIQLLWLTKLHNVIWQV